VLASGDEELRYLRERSSLFEKKNFNSFLATFRRELIVFLRCGHFNLSCRKERARMYDRNDLNSGGIAERYLFKSK